MAISATPVQEDIVTVTGTSATVNSGSGWSTPSSGNLLILVCSFRVDSATANSPTYPSGFTEVHNSLTSNGGARGSIAWKEADGTESSLTVTAHSSDILHSWSLTAVEYDGTDLELSSGPEVSIENEADIGNFNAAPHSTGTINNTTANALCVSGFSVVNLNQWVTTGPTVNSGYGNITSNHGTGSNACGFAASKAVTSTGDQGLTWDTTDTGSYCYSNVLIFPEAATSTDELVVGHPQINRRSVGRWL